MMTFAQRQELDRIGDRAAVAMTCEIEDHHYTVTDSSVEVDGNELSLTVVVKFRQYHPSDQWASIDEEA